MHLDLGDFLPTGRRTVTLTKEQCRLLDLYMAAIAAESGAAQFTCIRMEGNNFVWIMHPGLYNDVRMADWDDMLELERLELIKILLSGENRRDCSFELTAAASVVHENCQAAQQIDDTITVSIDADV